MSSLEEKLKAIQFKREEWEDFFNSQKWKELNARWQEQCDILQRQVVLMPVRSVDDVLALLDARAELRGRYLTGQVADDISAEFDQLVLDAKSKEYDNGN